MRIKDLIDPDPASLRASLLQAEKEMRQRVGNGDYKYINWNILATKSYDDIVLKKLDKCWPDFVPEITVFPKTYVRWNIPTAYTGGKLYRYDAYSYVGSKLTNCILKDPTILEKFKGKPINESLQQEIAGETKKIIKTGIETICNKILYYCRKNIEWPYPPSSTNDWLFGATNDDTGEQYDPTWYLRTSSEIRECKKRINERAGYESKIASETIIHKLKHDQQKKSTGNTKTKSKRNPKKKPKTKSTRNSKKKPKKSPRKKKKKSGIFNYVRRFFRDQQDRWGRVIGKVLVKGLSKSKGLLLAKEIAKTIVEKSIQFYFQTSEQELKNVLSRFKGSDGSLQRHMFLENLRNKTDNYYLYIKMNDSPKIRDKVVVSYLVKQFLKHGIDNFSDIKGLLKFSSFKDQMKIMNGAVEKKLEKLEKKTKSNLIETIKFWEPTLVKCHSGHFASKWRNFLVEKQVPVKLLPSIIKVFKDLRTSSNEISKKVLQSLSVKLKVRSRKH
jgi:hypothetical protein